MGKANLARFGKPVGKLRERLPHESLISEVYVHLTEQGHYVYWILSEENLRREAVKEFWRLNVKKRDVMWFCYDHKEAGKIEFLTGQKAMILSENIFKSGELDKESVDSGAKTSAKNPLSAMKNETAAGAAGEIETPSLMKNQSLIEKWLSHPGGLTAQTAAFVGGIHYLTARARNLKDAG